MRHWLLLVYDKAQQEQKKRQKLEGWQSTKHEPLAAAFFSSSFQSELVALALVSGSGSALPSALGLGLALTLVRFASAREVYRLISFY